MSKLQWYRVVQTDDGGEGLPFNSPMRFEAGKRQICLVRTNQGFFALQNKCPHNGASLSMGHCEDNAVVCPLHRYHFDLRTGRAVKGGAEAALAFPVEVRPDGIYVGVQRSFFSL